MRRSLAVAIGAVVLFAAGILLGGGFYEVSAIRQHPSWIYWGLATGRNLLVGLYADDVQVPPDFEPLADPAGVALYQKHCTQCHGAPGVPPEDFALGLMPVPPPLVHSARTRSAAEIYWFIRHGLKMSGMPAWQGRMSEPDMWRITALVEAMPTLSPLEYAALVEASGGPVDAVEPLPPDLIPPSVAAADPERGRIAMQTHACRSCHIIPGLVGAETHVGPPLETAGSRRYIAGVLRNTPANMVRWIMNPQGIDPLTAMPDLDVTLGEARDMAAYLYSITPRVHRTGPAFEALTDRKDDVGFGPPASGS